MGFCRDDRARLPKAAHGAQASNARAAYTDPITFTFQVRSHTESSASTPAPVATPAFEQ